MNTKNLNYSILLVEDNPMDIDLTLRAFKKHEINNPIQVARDGAEALEFINHWQSGEVLPAIILLDLKLPKISGLEVLRQIKAHPQFGVIPIVVLTSSAEDVDIQEAYRLGANSYIVKPVDYDKFMDVVAHIEKYWIYLNIPPL